MPASDSLLLYSLKQRRTGSLHCSTRELAAQAQQTVSHTEDNDLRTLLLSSAPLYSRMRRNPLGEGGLLNWPPSAHAVAGGQQDDKDQNIRYWTQYHRLVTLRRCEYHNIQY